jgi:hypothetical protein
MSASHQRPEEPDFEVRYRFFTPDEGGRQTGPPHQGSYRSDWAYDGDDISRTGIHMIWPEFIDDHGAILSPDAQVRVAGHARMWIVSPGMRTQVHQARIREGVRGYFMEGSRRVAEAVVTRIVALHANASSHATPVA